MIVPVTATSNRITSTSILRCNLRILTNDLIYVFGALTDWKCLPANQMIYQPDTKLYEATLLLKQGFFDYQYVLSIPKRRH